MKNGVIIVAGAFFALAFSWAVLIHLSAVHPSLGFLAPIEDELTGEFIPSPTAGLADRGRKVYVELGCVACHTQQVRRPGFGADAERGWGERQSVARDFVGHATVQLGEMRMGPDLRTIGQRDVPDEWSGLSWEQYRHLHLFNPRSVVDGSIMPSFPFLYEKRRIHSEPSPRALPLEVEEGYEIVPTRRAEALVAYLRSLRLDYNLPEAAHLTVEARQQQQNEQE
jgi:cytochrome c oxidase cbb3-type subunit II